jgi:hypothetical protein
MCKFRHCAQGMCQRHSVLQCYRCVWSVLMLYASKTSPALAQAGDRLKLPIMGAGCAMWCWTRQICC